MQRFEVVGVNKESLEDVLVEIEAFSEDNAKVKANLKGIIATSIKLCLKVEETVVKDAVVAVSADNMYCPSCKAHYHQGTPGDSVRVKKLCPACDIKPGICPFCNCHLEGKNSTACSVCCSSWGDKYSPPEVPIVRTELLAFKEAEFDKNNALSTATPKKLSQGLKQCSDSHGLKPQPVPWTQSSSEKKVLCPKCGSVQISANKRGFNGGIALVGALAFGGIGLLGGTIGSGKVSLTCLKCGKQWKPKTGDSK